MSALDKLAAELRAGLEGAQGGPLWLWSMGGIKRAPLGFLHHWYYQTLEHSGRSLRVPA